MKIYYGRRIHVPRCCPTCGNEQFHGDPETTPNWLGYLLASYKIGCDTYKTGWEGYPQWWGYCIKCSLREELSKPSPMWEYIKSRSDNKWEVEIQLGGK